MAASVKQLHVMKKVVSALFCVHQTQATRGLLRSINDCSANNRSWQFNEKSSQRLIQKLPNHLYEAFCLHCAVNNIK